MVTDVETSPSRARCLVAGLAGTAVAVTLLIALTGDAAAAVRAASRSADVELETLLLRWAALVGWLAVGAAWSTWVATTWRVAVGRPVAGRGPVRRLAILACGCVAATVVGVAPTAAAGGSSAGAGGAPGALAEEPRLVGLALPDRATAPRPARGAVHVVRVGESLWSIAVDTLPAEASAAQVTRRWQAIHARNRGSVGDDPDLIHPGQRLVVPGDRHGEDPS